MMAIVPVLRMAKALPLATVAIPRSAFPSAFSLQPLAL
jgi:hypothetical protein